MRIKNIQKTDIQIEKGNSLDGKRTAANPSVEFRRQITSLNHENYDLYIKDVMAKITRQGELVSQKADLGEFQKYRELITKLLNETVSNSYEFCKMNKFDDHGRHKTFTLIKKVNQKLDEMASALLKEQSNNLQMMNMVDDIRGMLVDLYL
ncbi:MAG: YaaR family protein [Christensenellales bacterium]